ncbi:unnamed protein product [Closterium sp. Yama58-4]|nr:unnamed protein product [Closterium sp. Yama58-4]
MARTDCGAKVSVICYLISTTTAESPPDRASRSASAFESTWGTRDHHRPGIPEGARLLLCAALCTVYGASGASLLVPFLPHHGGSSAGASSTANPSAAFSAANPSGPVVHRRLILKWVAHLHPSKLNGKVVGDKGASGKVKLKVVELTPSL